MKTVIVTGASRGIGLAIAQHLLRSDSVFVVGTGRSASVGNAGLTRLVEDSRFSYIQGDVCEAVTQQRCIYTALTRGNGLHAVVFNAGVIDPVERIANIDVDAMTPASPSVPGKLVANLVLDMAAHLSGQFLSWNDDRLREYL